VSVLHDGNVLAALSAGEHVHRETGGAWFAGHDEPFATTPATKGMYLRFLLREVRRGGDGVLDAGGCL
jgi:hypothetical protein